MSSTEENNVLDADLAEILEGEFVDAQDVDAQDGDTDEAATPEDPLAAAQRQAEEYLQLAQRARADLENNRRRTTKEREELLRYGSERVLKDLLSALDDVERGIEHAADGSPLAEGFRMLHKSLIQMLERHSVTEVPGAGAPFDPNVHNAIQTVADSPVEKNHVVDVYQKGYLLHDRLLRPAMVSVAG